MIASTGRCAWISSVPLGSVLARQRFYRTRTATTEPAIHAAVN